MSVTEILESVQYVIDKQGQQTAVLFDMTTWDTLRQLLEDLEDMLEIETARQENEKTVSWMNVVAEYQEKYLAVPNVQD